MLTEADVILPQAMTRCCVHCVCKQVILCRNQFRTTWQVSVDACRIQQILSASLYVAQHPAISIHVFMWAWVCTCVPCGGQVRSTVIHELIHAYDDCQAKARGGLNWNDCQQHACTEVRFTQ